MSTIGRFLQAKEPLFDHALHQLELQSHQKGVDIKLAAEIAETAGARMTQMGFPASATGPELSPAPTKPGAAPHRPPARPIRRPDRARPSVAHA